MKKHIRLLTILLSCAVMLVASTLAQGRTGTISGVVRDETGAVLSGATVTIRNVDTGIVRTVVSDEDGRYRVPALELGEYEVSAELVGFRTYRRAGIVLTLEREAVVNLTLSIGGIAEEITVLGGGTVGGYHLLWSR